MSKNTKTIKTIENIESGECRWPIGDPRHADFHFCGAHKAVTGPYCKHHQELAVEASKPRQASTTPSFAMRRAA